MPTLLANVGGFGSISGGFQQAGGAEGPWDGIA